MKKCYQVSQLIKYDIKRKKKQERKFNVKNLFTNKNSKKQSDNTKTQS